MMTYAHREEQAEAFQAPLLVGVVVGTLAYTDEILLWNYIANDIGMGPQGAGALQAGRRRAWRDRLRVR
jgi:hypothetical protein